MRDLITIAEGGVNMRDPEARRAKLKAEIEAGELPIVHNVSSTVDPVYTMNDVEALGWMEKRYITDRRTGDVEGWERTYFGPEPIRVQTMGSNVLTVLKKGDTLD